MRLEVRDKQETPLFPGDRVVIAAKHWTGKPVLRTGKINKITFTERGYRVQVLVDAEPGRTWKRLHSYRRSDRMLKIP